MPASSTGVQFVEAVAHLKDRLGLSESDWSNVLHSAGAKADAVVDAQASSMRRDLLAAASEIYEAGGTARDFSRRYTEIADRYGWASPGGSGWHSNLIWRMETFGAQSAGRWEQAWRLQRARPNIRYYFRYVTAGDHRVRDTHRQWHGIILPIGHWFWRTHFPPNGFNCRCHVMIVTEQDLVRYGWAVTAENDPRLGIPPDPGFDSNVGIAWQELRGETAEAAPAPAAPGIAPAPPPTLRPAPSPPSPPPVSLRGLVDYAESLPPATKVEIAQMPAALAERLGAVEVAVNLSADTIARHRHHPEATAEAYAEIVPRLLLMGQFIPDPKKPNHGRFIAEFGTVIWAAIVKVDRHGRLWLSSLHRSNRRQMRKWLRRD